jgi:broad specificity phosphatase PhoE
MMGNKITLPCVPFYFVRHGQTDWNKMYQVLCDQDDIPLNETGLLQAAEARDTLRNRAITKIYSSPLARAKQTAEIINQSLAVCLEFHEGLRDILPEKIAVAFVEILEPSHTTLIVSHGEVYRVLLRIANAQAVDMSAKNGGVYLFSPRSSDSDQWIVKTVFDKGNHDASL